MKFRDKRRKHPHWRVTMKFAWGDTFVRVFTDRAKAARCAARQKKSPMVKSVQISVVDFATLPWAKKQAARAKQSARRTQARERQRKP
jgi:hypothetical protein